MASDAEWPWGLAGPAHRTQTAGRQLQEQLDDKMWTEAGATPTKLPNRELWKGQLHSSEQSPVSSRARDCCALCQHRSGPVGALCSPRALLRNKGPRVTGGAGITRDEEGLWVAWRLLRMNTWQGGGEG